jgi:nucleoside-diphosphate-sugar epimerase
MRETVLVTGSSGRVGAAVAERLATTYQVVGFDRQAPAEAPAGIDSLAVDLCSDGSVRAGLDAVRRRHGERLAAVLHLAAYCDLSDDASPSYDEVNVRGTERLLRVLQAFQLGQFVLGSTILVHRPCHPGQHITEDWPLDPRWAYPRSKLQSEEAVRALHGAAPFVLVRLAEVYDDDCHCAPLARQVQRILERRLTSHLFPGNVHHGRPFVHREDVVEALARVVGRRAQLPAELPLLIGEPETVSYRELQVTLGRLLYHEEWRTRAIPKGLARMGVWLQDHLPFVEEPPLRPRMIDQADDHYALDISRAYKLLDWESHRSLRETLPKMVAALQADPCAWYWANGLNPPANLRGTREPIGQGAAGLR